MWQQKPEMFSLGKANEFNSKGIKAAIWSKIIQVQNYAFQNPLGWDQIQDHTVLAFLWIQRKP